MIVFSGDGIFTHMLPESVEALMEARGIAVVAAKAPTVAEKGAAYVQAGRDYFWLPQWGFTLLNAAIKSPQLKVIPNNGGESWDSV